MDFKRYEVRQGIEGGLESVHIVYNHFSHERHSSR